MLEPRSGSKLGQILGSGSKYTGNAFGSTINCFVLFRQISTKKPLFEKNLLMGTT